MSTPGRKRVQPIFIEDDDDTDCNTNEIPVSSLAFDINLQEETTPIITSLSPELCSSPSSSSLPSRTDIQQPIKKNPYVALNFDELSHIRNVQTNSEFAILLYDINLYTTVVNGYICFSCRKVKFSLLNPGICCTICLQRICSKCQRKINSRQDNICFVSLNLLRRYSTAVSSSFSNNISVGKNEKADSESSSSSTSTANRLKDCNKKKISNSSFPCCLDCFILFDPTTIV
ncbi:unnamed protein product [Rotaria magnacalcarata]|uniref:Uncharacterized protein n=1 Tax=Rotaria magnacalcarata TaxID=392030 RepID=A0A817AS86_9BILA|nr:unnamed protein product [Rotaria magnacalcarata]CAF1479741.1 unnamed protein product [Rotaria magnacalcarata]CAF1976831.1 unnamed protein product [Rotaria magnacalcarata]CAF2148897.1 unnamed protein product [Rotaria magnacalcarata]CAF2272012.1 unnamed protein product [Rotaria magnacalcarata]